jgi:hypothetical protein
MRRINPVLCSLITVVLFGAAVGLGQNAPLKASPPVNVAGLPPELRAVATALGDRLWTPGKERLTISGSMTRSGNTYPATVTLELPNYFRLDEGGPDRDTLAFDGKSSWASYGSLKEEDEGLLESFLDDAAESMFFSLQRGSTMRLIARGAQLEVAKGPVYSGASASIYEIIGRPWFQPDNGLRQKQYYFDSRTLSPVLVRYRAKKSDGSVVFVETARTNWTKTNGQTVPGTVSRSESGKSMFAFQVSAASFSAAASDGWFSKK